MKYEKVIRKWIPMLPETMKVCCNRYWATSETSTRGSNKQINLAAHAWSKTHVKSFQLWCSLLLRLRELCFTPSMRITRHQGVVVFSPRSVAALFLLMIDEAFREFNVPQTEKGTVTIVEAFSFAPKI